jgi:glyoxylate/hydroxypyruvate reductase
MSAKYKVVVTRQLPEAGQVLLDQADDIDIVQWTEDRPCDRSWLLQHVKGTAGILLMLTEKVDEELIAAAGDGLKVVASFSVGTDHITLPVLKSHNIRLGYTPTALTDACADIAVMLTLMAQRRAGESMRKVLDGQWPQLTWSPLLLTGPQIKGATIGFLGFGRIAQATLKRFLPFGISRAVYLTSRPGEYVGGEKDYFDVARSDGAGIPVVSASDWRHLASESDVLIVACGLTPETRHLVSTDFLKAMKKRAVLVNIARGPIVDTDALVRALDEEWIFGAGLDVVEGEPNVPKDHALLSRERCVVVPHIGSANIETREAMATESVRNLLADLRGDEMVNEVRL